MTTYRRHHINSPEWPVSSLRVTEHGNHATIAVWNRGGLAGTLVVELTDGPTVVNALLPPGRRGKVSDD